MNSKAQSTFNWEDLLDNIREEKCLLILGPEVFMDDTGVTVQSKLFQKLDLNNNPNIERYYSGDDFFQFSHRGDRTKFCQEIRRFYRTEQPGELIQLLTDIPFHIYMSVTPDTLVKEAFKLRGYQYQHGFYKKNTDPQPISDPSAENPLLYNLLGCIEDEESMVLSHDDLYDYFKSIFARRSMPAELKDELQHIRNLLFVGVPFFKWYLQIILRELEIHNQEYRFSRSAVNQGLNTEIYTLCVEQFRIQFVDKNVQDFIKELHHKVAQDPEISFRAGLKPKDENSLDIRNILLEGEIELAINILIDQLIESELYDYIGILSARYNRLKKRRDGGMLRIEDQTIEENSITEALFNLLKKIEEK